MYFPNTVVNMIMNSRLIGSQGRHEQCYCSGCEVVVFGHFAKLLFEQFPLCGYFLRLHTLEGGFTIEDSACVLRLSLQFYLTNTHEPTVEHSLKIFLFESVKIFLFESDRNDGKLHGTIPETCE